MDLPFTQTKLSENRALRTFTEDVDPSSLVWHMDRENRRIIVLEGDCWYLQLDNRLPIMLEVGKQYYIPKMTYHRVIKGLRDLVIEVQFHALL